MVKKICIAWLFFNAHLKGLYHEIFCLVFFNQTVPPGPFKDVPGQFNFLANFCRVIGLIKRFPNVRYTGETIRNDEDSHFLKT